MKYLIAGLGNIGEKYAHTRHNIGFTILDALAEASNIAFMDNRYASTALLKHKSRALVLIKPSTYVNLSGKAVRYWLNQEKIPVERLLVVLDDLALPFGTLRLKSKGGDAGHNGLKNINELLGHSNYARLRFGIGNEFGYGQQVDHVLGQWSDEENKQLQERVEKACEAIKSFSTVGIGRTMNAFNNK